MLMHVNHYPATTMEPVWMAYLITYVIAQTSGLEKIVQVFLVLILNY